MGAFGSAQIADLVGILDKLGGIIDLKNIALHRDDGFISTYKSNGL